MDLKTASPADTGPSRGSLLGGRADELADIIEERRRLVAAVAIGVSVLGLVVASLLPSLLPPRPLVGAAVGLAAVVLGIAVALTVDAGDLLVRGPRHIRAAGAPIVDDRGGLLLALSRRIERLGGSGRAPRVALVPVGREAAGVAELANALAVRLAGHDRRVLLADLTRPSGAGRPGLAEVAAGAASLAQAVEFDRDVMLARVGPGADLGAALEGLPRLTARLPSDIELLIVTLPSLAHQGALTATDGLDELLLVAVPDRTFRVELIASLDAADAAAVPAAVVLADPTVVLADPPAPPPPPAPPALELDDEALDESEAVPPTSSHVSVFAATPTAEIADEPTDEPLTDEWADADEPEPWLVAAIEAEADAETEVVVADDVADDTPDDTGIDIETAGEDPDRTEEIAPVVIGDELRVGDDHLHVDTGEHTPVGRTPVTVPDDRGRRDAHEAAGEPDALQVTVALHTLAQEVWGRDERA